MAQHPDAAAAAAMSAAVAADLRISLESLGSPLDRETYERVAKDTLATGLRALIEHERPTGHGDALGVFGWLDGVAAALEARGGL